MPPRPLTRLRKICLALPGAHEVEAWGEPTWRVKNKMFAMYAAHGHHREDKRPGVWIKSDLANQQVMIRHKPKLYFVPPYVGPSGWVGAWLDDAKWDVLEEIIIDAWRMTAPKKLIAQLED